MKGKKIVVTGGPGTGKTALIQSLEDSGSLCFHEIVRDMTQEAKKNGSENKIKTNPLAFIKDPYTFNEQLLEGRLRHYQKADTLEEPVIFFDRGMPDVLAYMDYFKQPYKEDFIKPCKENRYDMVLLLPPWEAIYVQDNERLENYREAVEIHHALENTYKLLGYRPIEVPTGTKAERLSFAKNIIKADARE
ncbi:AAA family ATPase [Maribacter sp. 2210JD10-5]|uniref:AAA family ATPase n=1 Tax=Maribacter sp. 2210JD10-5 TaxID=3386272 RepID=UPI0039BC87E8